MWNLNLIRDELKVLEDFTPLVAFKTIDTNYSGFITHNDLKLYLKSNGHLSTQSDLVSIVWRIDKDGDAMLNVDEFSDVLWFVEPGINFYLKHSDRER